MAFKLPLQNFFSRIFQPDAWVRPSDWPVITAAANEVKYLMSDIGSASCAISVTRNFNPGGALYIDWGDGVVDTVTTDTFPTSVSHQYTAGTGTPCSRGYTTFVIRVYGTAGSIILDCKLTPKLIAGNDANSVENVGLLEAYFGDGVKPNSSFTYSFSNNLSTGTATFAYLEYVKLPSTINHTSFESVFVGCNSLSKVDMPTSAPSLTTMSSTFNGCEKLQEIILPGDAININNLTTCFLNCFELKSIKLPNSLNSLASFSSAFSGCLALKNITLPSINSATSFANAFDTCISLEWIKFTSLPTFGVSTVVDFTSAFSSCTNLQNVYFPENCSANANYTFASAFANCVNIKTITFPVGFNPSNLQSAFNCRSLKSVIFKSGASNLANMTNAFQDSTNLTYVRLPDNASSSGVNLTSTFANCTSLESITIPDNYLVLNMTSSFTNCSSLKTINWTPGVQNSLTSLNSTFANCRLLKNFTLPTSMNALTSLSSTFLNCKQITSVTLPSTLNAVTTMATMFNGCSSLRYVTLPTSMSLCTDFSSSFRSCFEIETVVLPNVVRSTFTTLSNTFDTCYSLVSVTFPGSQQLSALTNMTAIFNNCGNLKTLVNFDKLGPLTSTTASFSASRCNIPSISFGIRLSSLSIDSTDANRRNNLASLRLLNTTTGQWTGGSPQINIRATNMSTSALVQLFNDMAAQGTVTAKTINITNATGAAGLTASDRLIITSIGWTITG